MVDESYVSNASWQRRSSRAETIDEIADQFERRDGAARFWDDVQVQRAARDARLAPGQLRRAG